MKAYLVVKLGGSYRHLDADQVVSEVAAELACNQMSASALGVRVAGAGCLEWRQRTTRGRCGGGENGRLKAW